MIIALPNDGTGNLYDVVDLLGIPVHTYRDRAAAERSLEGDQRVITRALPVNTYMAFYKRSTMEVQAATSYAAQQLAANKFGAKKAYDVTVVLTTKGDVPVLIDPASL